MSLAQLRLSETIERSGLSDAEVAVTLGVNQSTVSRLRNCRIAKVAKHQARLDARMGAIPDGHRDELAALFAMAKLSPPLRDMLIALQKLMHENA